LTLPSSIDPEEIPYYERLANQWWDADGKFWPLHRLNGIRTDYLKKRICKHFGRNFDERDCLHGLSIVDIGCGGGILSESMAEMGAEVTGIDVVSKSLEVARQHSLGRQIKIEYVECSAETLALSQRQFDVVLNMEVVEHVVELPLFLDSCAKLIKPGGLCFIATINRNPLSWLFAIAGAEYILGWLPRGTHRWSKFVKPAELLVLLERNGLQVEDLTGVSINPFNKRFSLNGNLLVNYMLSASLPQIDSEKR
jgi:2-polyprenyl-6-hydroxyphenyl methylase/3-demethylubiquinone-9 3-methyltransferase